jgi:integrase
MTTLRTEAQIKNAKKGVHRVVCDDGVCGFKKDSNAPGVGSYTVRYGLGGRRPTMGLGAFSEISMADACKAAKAARALAHQGIDPIVERDREKAANLAAERAKKQVIFRQSAEVHIAALSPFLKSRYARGDWFNPVVKYAFPAIGELSVNDITTKDVAAVVSAAAADGNFETGRRVQQRIRAILEGAVARGERNPLLVNPADAGKVSKIIPLKRKGDRPHFRIKQLDDAPAAFHALREALARATGLQAVALDVWLFMIATCARPSEARELPWAEIDLDRKLWRLPAARAKSEREHVTPLNSIACTVLARRLAARSGDCDAVFPGRDRGPISHTRFTIAPKATGLDLGTAHSWRSIWRDWAGDLGCVARDLAEAQLQHTLGSTEASYRRGSAIEARGAPLEQYARWLTGGDAGADILAFPARA